jgi:hypothetical protein
MATPIDLSTAGVHLYYAVETTSGTRPTTGYIDLPGVKSTPSLNPAPEALESTTLNETEWVTYVKGLKDLGGSLEFTFNLTQALLDVWEELITASEAGKATNLSTWFLIDIPGLTNGFYFRGDPADAGLPAIEVNSVLVTTMYITPTAAPTMAAKPTKS